MRAAERKLGDLAGQPLRPQIDQHQMRIGAAGDDIEAGAFQRIGQHFGVLDDILGVGLERRLERLAEGDRFGRDHMHQRAALHAGKHGRIELLGQRLVIGENDAAARTAQRLVRRRGDDMGVRKWRGMCTASDEPGKMRHVDHQQAAYLADRPSRRR